VLVLDYQEVDVGKVGRELVRGEPVAGHAVAGAAGGSGDRLESGKLALVEASRDEHRHPAAARARNSSRSASYAPR
jgi:hypothetical protein